MHMTEKQTRWQPGAIANGHILLEGEGWVPLTEHERRLREAHPQSSSTQDSAAREPSPTKAAWFKRTWVIALAAGVLGLVVGAAASGSTGPTDSPEYKAQAKELASLTAELNDAKVEIESIAGDLPDREAALKDGQTQLAKDQQDLQARLAAITAKEKAVAKREKAVGMVEKEIQANTISGDGVYEVGVDIKPGTYKSSGGSGMCYYAENGDANGNNIISNNIVDGGASAVTTVSAGHFFETSGCGDWVLRH
jgi:uncharacterized membrane-anchored protein YhcB (DUF1043 family)